MSQLHYIMAASLKPLAEPSDGPLMEVVLSPPGRVVSSKGNFVMDEKAFDKVLEEFKDRQIEIVIDYEHQSLGGEWQAPNGKAPAAGWIKELKYDPERGLIGVVQWTDEARKLIRSGEYKYISPVIVTNKGGRVIKLDSAALVNRPAIHGMAAVAASEKRTMKKRKADAKRHGAIVLGDDTYDSLVNADGEDVTADVVKAADEVGSLISELKAKLVAMGAASEEMDAESVLKAAIAKLQGGEEMPAMKQALADIRKSLSLKDDSDTKAIVAKVDELQAKRVSGDDFKALKDELAALKAVETKRNAEALVKSFVDEGFLNPNDDERMTWARQKAEADPESFKAFMAGAPKLYDTKRYVTPKTSGDKGHRETVIAKARTEWSANKNDRLKGLTVCNIINGNLGIENLPLLSKEERDKLEKECA